MKYLYSFFLLLLISSGSFAQSIKDYQNPEDVFSVSQYEEWLNLLHYKNKKSVVIDDTFFLSKEGYRNPKNELDELIKEYHYNETV